MLQLSESLLGVNILSIRTGGPVGSTISAIINPNNLKIEGFYCADRFSKSRLVLISNEIRDVIAEGIVVNDHEAMSDPKDLVRLENIMKINFDVIGKKVVTTDKKQLGKVNDYAVDNKTMYIQKLYVSQSIIKNLKGGQLSVDRTQIVEITDKKIVIQDIRPPLNNPIRATAPAS